MRIPILSLCFFLIALISACEDKGSQPEVILPVNPLSNPFPPHESHDINIIVRLGWDYADTTVDSIFYNIYLGTDPNPPVKDSLLTENRYVTGKLQHDTTYYWRIVAFNDTSDSTVGPIWSFNTIGSNRVVTFPDPNLEEAVREEIKRPIGDIYIRDIDTLKFLYASYFYIDSLQGLEYFASLVSLKLNSNKVRDLTPLKHLAYLKRLELCGNNLTDLTLVQDLSQLNLLRISFNQVTDLSPLEEFTHLNSLEAMDNQITDLTPLQNLNRIATLYLSMNNIVDLSPIQGLERLHYLYLDHNQIVNILPLVNNPGIGSENNESDMIILRDNPLDSISRYEYIELLIRRGADIKF